MDYVYTSTQVSEWTNLTNKQVLYLAELLLELPDKAGPSAKRFTLRDFSVILAASIMRRHGIAPKLIAEVFRNHEVVLNCFDEIVSAMVNNAEGVDGAWNQLVDAVIRISALSKDQEEILRRTLTQNFNIRSGLKKHSKEMGITLQKAINLQKAAYAKFTRTFLAAALLSSLYPKIPD